MSSHSGVRGGALTAQRFPLLSALRMASPNTIILFIVDVDHSHLRTRPQCPLPCVRPLPTVVDDDGIDAVLSFPGAAGHVRLSQTGGSGAGGGRRRGHNVHAARLFLVDGASTAGEAGAGAAGDAAKQVPVRVVRVVDVDLPRGDQVRPMVGRVTAPQTLQQHAVNQSMN